MNIPEKIVEAIELLPIVERGQLYCAVIGFMRNGTDPDFEMTDVARASYILARKVLEPILRRRKRDAANRLRKKLAAGAQRPADNEKNTAKSPMPSAVEPVPSVRATNSFSDRKTAEEFFEHIGNQPLTRQQRRKLQRMKEKSMQRLSA